MVQYYTHLEDYIKNLYLNIGIVKSEQIDINTIATRLRIKVILVPFNSMRANNVICINESITKEEQWEVFGHELCHALLHSGNQFGIPSSLREYQEWKANNFALHFCVPTFMINQLELPNTYQESVSLLRETFHLSTKFACKRLDRYITNNHNLEYCFYKKDHTA